MNESVLREEICRCGALLYERGLATGSSGNISVRLDDGWLLTPTNACLGRLDPARLSKLDWNGNLVSGDPASKEAFLHRAMYEERAGAGAIVPPAGAIASPAGAMAPVAGASVAAVGATKSAGTSGSISAASCASVLSPESVLPLT